AGATDIPHRPPLGCYGPSKETVSLSGPLQRDSNPKGAELRKRAEHLLAKRGRHPQDVDRERFRVPEHAQWIRDLSARLAAGSGTDILGLGRY
ncbi:hypothetical protein, partial [Collinsella ihumii]|uniref:hypothetical protein n=1 Tax=Collinsella ihumii TaxID=1720204 RepID=UPI0025AAF20A